jgi:hypothetical protein
MSLPSSFHLDELGSSLKQEVTAGLTTFVTMAYIIIVSPKILEVAGMPFGPSMVATILSASFGTLLMGAYARRPFFDRTVMGENAFIAFTVVRVMGYSRQTALGAVFISGVLFTITLNRPEVHNALNEQMKEELNDALKEAETDAGARCVVLRGAGDKAFCSGQDLKEHTSGGVRRSLKESLEKSYNPMIRRIRSMEKPIIGMINGVAAGAGLSIALACDLRIMADTAKLIEVFVRIALVPDSGSHWFPASARRDGKGIRIRRAGQRRIGR